MQLPYFLTTFFLGLSSNMSLFYSAVVPGGIAVRKGSTVLQESHLLEVVYQTQLVNVAPLGSENRNETFLWLTYKN